MEKTHFEQEILRYALTEVNYERFATLLSEILPAYVRWVWGQDGIYRRHFNDWQTHGFNLMPNHYYSPIPYVGQIERRLEQKTCMIGINLREADQLHFLGNICPLFKEEYARFPENKTGEQYQFHFNNGVFERVDAEVLHCMVRHNHPKRIIEVGSGYSTLISSAAICMNKTKDGKECELVAIEPFPNDLFKAEIPGLSRLIEKPLQEIDIGLFRGLEENDILFIDSSHVLKTGSDVQMLYLEILPQIKKGVLVHVHDIFLPAEYPKTWIKEEHIFWNEQYLLQAFLSFNASFEVVWAGSFMHLNYPEILQEVFPGYIPRHCLPGSFWIRRIS